jgi:hemin uptake protein HemP
MNVFDAFTTSTYTYLVISRGGVAGNVIESEIEAEGVFKLRSGMNVSSDQETKSSDATLHIKPDESFTPEVGNGIRHDGQEYEIVGVTGGVNYDTGETEHYRATLQATEFSDES